MSQSLKHLLSKKTIMIKVKKCLECRTEFKFDTSARYKRKYCKKCSKKRKKMWDNQWKIKFEDLDDE